MNKELEEAKKVLNMWNKAEEIVINEDTSYDKKIYIQRKQAIETVLNYIDNSISKEVIEKKIEELKQSKEYYQMFPDDYLAEIGISILKEILEVK